MYLEAKTEYTKDVLQNFAWFIFSPRRSSRVICVIFLVVYPLLTLFLIALLFISGFEPLMMIAPAACIFLTLYVYLRLIFIPRKQYKEIKDRLAHPYIFVFEDDRFTVQSNNPILAGETRGTYAALFKAYATPQYIYLFISPNQAFILGKKDFLIGTADELLQKLREELGKKLIVR